MICGRNLHFKPEPKCIIQNFLCLSLLCIQTLRLSLFAFLLSLFSSKNCFFALHDSKQDWNPPTFLIEFVDLKFVARRLEIEFEHKSLLVPDLHGISTHHGLAGFIIESETTKILDFTFSMHITRMHRRTHDADPRTIHASEEIQHLTEQASTFFHFLSECRQLLIHINKPSI